MKLCILLLALVSSNFLLLNNRHKKYVHIELAVNISFSYRFRSLFKTSTILQFATSSDQAYLYRRISSKNKFPYTFPCYTQQKSMALITDHGGDHDNDHDNFNTLITSKVDETTITAPRSTKKQATSTLRLRQIVE